MPGPMGLTIPAVGSAGPAYAQNVSDDLSTIEGHDHTTGKGNQVPSAAMNINADLAFNNKNVTALKAARFQSQGAPLAGGADALELSVVNNELTWNSADGAHFAITSGHGLNVSNFDGFTNLHGTGASAYYDNVNKKFTLSQSGDPTAATDVPAQLVAGIVAVRQQLNGTKKVLLTSKAGLGADVTVVLPGIARTFLAANPGSALPLSVDASGVESSGQITTAQIADGQITTAKMAAQSLQALAYVSGWSDTNGGDVRYWIDQLGIVRFKGSVHFTTAAGTLVNSAAVATNYRPAFNRAFTIIDVTAGATHVCTITAGGIIVIASGIDTHDYDLSSISYLGGA